MLAASRKHSPNVLITDAENPAVIAACRALASKGQQVTAVAGARLAPAHWSRSPDHRHVLPHPLADEEGFVVGVQAILGRRRHAVLLPGSDASLLAVSKHRARFEHSIALGLPSHSIVIRCLDKLALSRAATAVGLAPPRTAVCSGLDEVESAAGEFGFPVILKPHQVIVEAQGSLVRPGSKRVASRESLPRVTARFGEPCLVQSAVPGSIVSYAGVIDNGKLLARAVSRYVRTWPPHAGSASFSETFKPPASLDSKAQALLAELEWRGIFELELIDREDGGWSAIDFNPRVYGSLALATAAGVNLPAIWTRSLLGDQPRPDQARAGVRFRREEAELRNFLWHLRGGRLRSAARVARPYRRVAHALFKVSDPGPAIAHFLLEVRDQFRRIRSRFHRGRPEPPRRATGDRVAGGDAAPEARVASAELASSDLR